MPDYLLHKDAYEAINRSVFVIGAGRTGSTLSGRIVQSFAGMEYVYESSMLHSLIPMIDTLPQRQFQVLFETYLYEEKFLDMVTGRGWNFNEKDESSILKVKTEAEIKARTGVSMGKLMAMEKAREAVLVIKLTDVVPFARRLKGIYPGMRFVLTHREAYGCISSLLKKEWFSDRTLKARDLVWNGTFTDGILLPHWLPAGKRKAWMTMSALERSALYYREMYSSLKGVAGLYFFSYERLIREPGPAIRDLAAWIGAGTTANTERIIATVRDNSAVDESVLTGLTAADREDTLRYSDPAYVQSLMRE
jgi:hypothetical protein